MDPTRHHIGTFTEGGKARNYFTQGQGASQSDVFFLPH